VLESHPELRYRRLIFVLKEFAVSSLYRLCPVAVLAALLIVPAARAENNTPPAGFRALFNGKDLSGWYGYNPHSVAKQEGEQREATLKKMREEFPDHWRVENGEIVNPGTGPYATTDEEFGDIELFVDYKMSPKGDSGIYLRATPQVQIWDYREEGGSWRHGADKGSGGLWNNSKGAPGKDPLVLADNPIGEWNTLRIIQVGARTTVYLNGKLVVDHATMENFWDRKLPLVAKGPVQLQTHGSEIRWRNVYVREIPPAEANQILAKHGSEGFESVFNGQDLAGWEGATDNYEVTDGAIRCKKGTGGNLYTAGEYADFVARLEIRLPAGGNNGLAIRYPGKGNPAYDAFCELQVLDNTAEKYAKLDQRQYHGSAYGMVPAVRGYLRPVGEWNFQEVTVQGTNVKVELNGSVILDADLSKVTDFMADHKHPGLSLTSGHFGFAGHGDAVEFRNVQIKRLDSASTTTSN
jgi:hypothetical protein